MVHVSATWVSSRSPGQNSGPGRWFAAVQVVPGWPPIHEEFRGLEIRDAVGARLTPDATDPIGWELLLGLEVTGEGAASTCGAGAWPTGDPCCRVVRWRPSAEGRRRPPVRRSDGLRPHMREGGVEPKDYHARSRSSRGLLWPT